MKEVLIYVEGSSDELAMNALLKDLITRKYHEGVAIQFFEAPSGDKKASVMQKVPRVAVNILRNRPDSIVVAMPDLYPYNKVVPHQTADELQTIIHGEFKKALTAKNLAHDTRYLERFKVFCFKHDLEALVLAAHEALALRLDNKQLPVTWHLPVENQNNDQPPKRVVQALFELYGQHYQETVDTPLILGLSDYNEIAEACPQCFKPFVTFLERVTAS